MPSSPVVPSAASSQGYLLACLGRVPDPRRRRGVRYPLSGLLAVSIGAVMAGARSLVAVGQWAGALTCEDLDRLGLRAAPGASNLGKVLARVDAAALDLALAAFAWCKVRQVDGRTVVAVDGKTVRGARTALRAAPHLVAALDQRTGAVLGQVAVADRSNEIPAVRDLLAGFDPDDLEGAVVTVDAMHTQTSTAQAICAAGAHYVLTVKKNQPGLHRRLKTLPWEKVPVGSTSTQHGHGRRTTRTLKVVDAPAWTGFPAAAQVAQLRRTRTVKSTKTVEVVYLVTSATSTDAPPHVLAAWVTGHRAVENRLHWVRDVTYDEDRSQVRTGSAPVVMATLPNTAITVLRLTGWTSIAAANRHHAYHPPQAITCLQTC